MKTEIKTNVYEIKVNRKWSQVRATSMLALNTWCESMGIKEWRSAGMMSFADLAKSRELIIVG